ncbi:pilus assembly protein TadG-related protein [Gimesia sp.]|uniref:pilus assembly protein TadG-related protein n=1 Tax=Gimesia sp. TaxID=2024833 RepID=UPI000C65BBF2|nr:pilus assembly protein TadG-related protein [Gimesia sp.]MAX40993.1 hypothetical protein [Gimesia sp.]HAH45430.1 hypothetical protein [Planctomycetaceae bacterium]HBL47957.1 hypothetical protein [Planctomycetaceae bacterium]|tara:strand:+ start:26392 stop:26985 length:594 start_codon:yes stop_codon:yes gene_type:complete
MMRIHSNRKSQSNRRGIAVLWLIIWGSFFLTFFCVVLEIATLWAAQVEVNNAMDAAALAAVKDWGERITLPMPDDSTEFPRDVGVAYATANPIQGTPAVFTTNYDVGNPSNENLSCDGNLVFGGLITPPPYEFDAGADALNPAVLPAVRAQVTVPVQGFCATLFGFTVLNVSASSTAYYDTGTGQPVLVHVTTFTCP